MEHFYLHFLHGLAGHPHWAEAVVFLASLLESVAFIGTFIPGSTTLFLAGALVGAGALGLWPTLAWAVAGAVLGDGASFWIGRRYKTQITALGPFRRHPDMLEQGQSFFARHGGKSVLLARFVGPVRAVVPVVAGMLDMPPSRFYLINVLSALAWAPAHMLPGLVFGASLQLAGAVTFRLAIILLLFATVLWAGVQLVRLAIAHGVPRLAAWSDRLLAWARRADSRANRFALRLLDANQPAAGALLLMSLLLLAGGWVFLGVLQDVLAHDPLVSVDSTVYRFLRTLHTPWGGQAMVAIATLGSLPTLLAVVLAVAAWLAWRRHWRTLGYWLATAAFSQPLILIIGSAVARHPPPTAGSALFSFPSAHVTSSAVVFGFLAFLLARSTGERARDGWRAVIAGAATALVLLVALADLYLGRNWLSDAIGGIALGVAWVAVVSLVYAYHRVAALRVREVASLTAAVLLVSVGLQWRIGQAGAPPPYPAASPVTSIGAQQWREAGWRQLPTHRSDLEGDRQEAFGMQWAGPLERIDQHLQAHGWRAAAPLSASRLLLLLAPHTPVMQLPVLPKLNDGTPPALQLIHAGDTPDTRLVLRLWPTRYRVSESASAPAQPLWLGSVAHESVSHTLRLVNIVRIDRQASPAGRSLAALLDAPAPPTTGMPLLLESTPAHKPAQNK